MQGEKQQDSLVIVEAELEETPENTHESSWSPELIAWAGLLVLVGFFARGFLQREPQESLQYTFASCERHLSSMLELFGSDPADWPEHRHALESGQRQEWSECHRTAELGPHKHPDDPREIEWQHHMLEDSESFSKILKRREEQLEPYPWLRPRKLKV